MNCIKCGTILPEGAIFCHKCGKKQVIQKRKYTRRAYHFGSITEVKGRSKPFKVWLPSNKDSGREFLGYYASRPGAEGALEKALGLRHPDKATATLGRICKISKTAEP